MGGVGIGIILWEVSHVIPIVELRQLIPVGGVLYELSVDLLCLMYCQTLPI